eukprot:Plantae.Rhodophyta-Hildenbrandia_rubra.ctg23505.p1 GENE.Plantae.Rhodophyta-Hildenbrandia_rubra.ctg23505~~Plantae.Rhodophyta-Hildenbrandia_rubra.ctg23505.p1  ORF type:complete len:354 (-),score=40.25 Plantae.Rhodophyta-Hildenbrandia_rubra.ctg23505:1068-2129(-)
MKCVTVSAFGEVNDVVNVVTDFPKPELKPGSGQMLIRVHACSTSPGDWRTMSGSTDAVRKPKFPYIPSQDVCGIVVNIDGDGKFKVGDCIVGTWNSIATGGMAEYALVDPKLAVKKPTNISGIEGAALANSAVHAMLALRNAGVKSSDRVLVIGGSGGVGTSIVQLLRDAKVSYIASVSTDEALMKSLGVDRNVNYREQAWWDVPEFKCDRFDLIIDCAQGLTAWKNSKSVLKTGWNGGRFLAVVMDNPAQEFHSYATLLSWFASILFRKSWTWLCRPFVANFEMFLGAPRGESLSQLFKRVEEGRIKAVLDPKSPFPFTTAGARAAYLLQASTHAHGKIVVEISSDKETTND